MERDLSKDVRALRMKKGIGSRELSRLIGKAETYISQLERGLIKNPDYQTVFEIMKHLGIKEDNIEDYLFNSYFIKSPLRIEAEEHWLEQEVERSQDPEYQEYLLDMQIEQYEQEQEWLKSKGQELLKRNFEIQKKLTYFIDKNLDTFEDVINNLHSLVMSMNKNKEDYDFFTKLFKRDLTAFDEDSKKRIVETIAEEYQKSSKGWGKPRRF